MKYIKTFESHRSSKKILNDEIINEGIFSFIGNLFKKAKAYINKIKGGQEVEVIYNKYLKIINDQFASQAKVQLNLMAADQIGEGRPVNTDQVKSGATSNPGATQNTNTDEKMNYKSYKLIKEADDNSENTEVDTKTNVQNLKSKKTILDTLIKKYKEIALKEMDNILKKYGGPTENPQLAIIIDTKKNQFDLDFLNAQINFFEKSGDKTVVNEYIKQRDAIAKNIENIMKNIDTVKPIEIKEGGKYFYKDENYTEKENDWKNALKDKFDPESQTFKNFKNNKVVGYAELKSVNGEEILFNENGKEVKKTKSDILGVSNVVKKEQPEIEIKEGEKYVYKRDNFKEENWNKLSSEDKSNPESEEFKKLIESGEIGYAEVMKINNDEIEFKSKEEGNPPFKKTKSDILGKTNESIKKELEIKKDEKYFYKRGKFDQSKWNSAPDDKFNPESETFKRLNKDKMVGYRPISRINGDNVYFIGGDNKEFKKTKSDILGTKK